jgi:hypothetical protein
MPNGLDMFPLKVADFDEDGLNNALDILVANGVSRDAASALRDSPRTLRMVAKRVFRLNAVQRAALLELTDDDLHAMAAPLMEALVRDDPSDFRAILTQQVTRESPLRVSCTITVDTK